MTDKSPVCVVEAQRSARRRCAWLISNSVSRVMGKQPCEQIVRYELDGKHYCAKHIVYAKAKAYDVLIHERRGAVSEHGTINATPKGISESVADWWDTRGRARFNELPIRDAFHAAKLAWEAALSRAVDRDSVIEEMARHCEVLRKCPLQTGTHVWQEAVRFGILECINLIRRQKRDSEERSL